MSRRKCDKFCWGFAEYGSEATAVIDHLYVYLPQPHAAVGVERRSELMSSSQRRTGVMNPPVVMHVGKNRGSECEAALSAVTMCAQWAAWWSCILILILTLSPGRRGKKKGVKKERKKERKKAGELYCICRHTHHIKPDSESGLMSVTVTWQQPRATGWATDESHTSTTATTTCIHPSIHPSTHPSIHPSAPPPSPLFFHGTYSKHLHGADIDTMTGWMDDGAVMAHLGGSGCWWWWWWWGRTSFKERYLKMWTRLSVNAHDTAAPLLWHAPTHLESAHGRSPVIRVRGRTENQYTPQSLNQQPIRWQKRRTCGCILTLGFTMRS